MTIDPRPPLVNVPGARMLDSGNGWSLQRVDDVMVLSYRVGRFNISINPCRQRPFDYTKLATTNYTSNTSDIEADDE